MKKRAFVLIFISVFILFSFLNIVSALTANISMTETPWFTANKASFQFTDLNNGSIPFPVFLEGFRSAPRDSIINYDWNFGDGSPHINESGAFNAAHVYTTPGTFTATLTVTDSTGATASASMFIYATNFTRYRYIDYQTGNDSCLGTSMTRDNSTNCPWLTAQPVLNQLTTGIRDVSYLFKRGGVYNYTTGVNPHSTENILLSSYGTGAKPIIISNLGVGDFIGHVSTNPGVYDFRFQDIDFIKMDNGGGSVWGDIGGGSYNILFYNVNITGFYSSIVFSANPTRYGYEAAGIFFVNSEIHNSSQVAFSAFGGTRVVLMNSLIDHSDNHNVYTDTVDKAFIYNFTSTRPAFGRAALRVAGGANVTYPSQNIYVGDSFFGGWIDPLNTGGSHNGGGNSYNYLLVQFSPQHLAGTNDSGAVVFNYSRDELFYTFENNIITNAQKMMVISSAENMTIRNNLFISNSTQDNALQIGVSSGAIAGAVDQKPSKNIKIIGNTFVNRNRLNNGVNIYSFIRIENYSEPFGQSNPAPYPNHENISIINNIFYITAPNSNGNMNVITIDHNDSSLIKSITIDYNNYYNENGQSNLMFNIGNFVYPTVGISYNITKWVSLGYDIHSIYGNPLFNSFLTSSLSNPSYLDYNSFTPNLVLQPNSPAIGKGTNLGSLLFYDFNGNLRSANSTIGAYENLSTAVIIPPTQTCNNGIIEGTETCEGTNFGIYGNGSILCSTYNSQFTSGNLACTNCQIDTSSCITNTQQSGGNTGGPLDTTNPPTVYTSKSLAISGTVLLNNQSGVYTNQNLNITFINVEESTQTDANGNFNIIFNNMNFTSGVNQIDIKLINSGVVFREYQKQIYISA